jgi:hypothetical protein
VKLTWSMSRLAFRWVPHSHKQRAVQNGVEPAFVAGQRCDVALNKGDISHLALLRSVAGCRDRRRRQDFLIPQPVWASTWWLTAKAATTMLKGCARPAGIHSLR